MIHVIDAVLLPNTSSTIEEVIASKSIYMYSVDILGKKIAKTSKDQLVFDIYSNGEIIKRFVK